MKYLGAVLIGVVGACLLLLAGDTYAHAKFDDFGGLNRWGYRGRVVGMKEPGEYRIVVLGGSTAFGYGVRYWEAWPAQLEDQLHAPRPADGHLVVGRRDITVINLGYNAEGSYAMRQTLDDFEWLRPDAVLLYEGYNDLGGINRNVFRRDSVVFRKTGYLPILPLVLHEKLMALQSGGFLDAAYRDERVVFHPTLGQRASIAGVSGADAVVRSLTKAANRLAPNVSAKDVTTDPIAWYVTNMSACIDWAHSRNLPVLVVGQPTVSAMHVAQQDALRAMVNRHIFVYDEAAGLHSAEVALPPSLAVRYINLGSLIDLHDTSLVLDGLHLNREGNRRIADALVSPILDQWQEFMSR